MEIRLEKLTKSFADARVIEDLDLHIADREMIALLGPSGCGKTTTLLAIAGILAPSSGRIWFGPRDVTELPAQVRNVGIVFQSFALYPHLTVFDNIAFPLRVRKEPRAAREQKVRAVAAVLHIDDVLDRRPAQLSGGQQQRVALARALVRDPDVLLLDEPLANLDARLRLEMRSEIRRIHREAGCSAILVTHDQVDAMSMCDRIALMRSGRIEQIDTPTRMYDCPRSTYAAQFLGSPPISLVPGVLRDHSFVSPGLRFDAPQRLGVGGWRAGETITAGIRPEHIQSQLPSRFEAKITFVETHGREVLYELALPDGGVLRSVQSGSDRYRVGDTVRWGVDPGAVHFFDSRGHRIE